MTKQETIYCRIKINNSTIKSLQKLADNNEIVWIVSRKELLKMWRKK